MNPVDPTSAAVFASWAACACPLLALMFVLAPPMGLLCTIGAVIVGLLVFGVPFLWIVYAFLGIVGLIVAIVVIGLLVEQYVNRKTT